MSFFRFFLHVVILLTVLIPTGCTSAAPVELPKKKKINLISRVNGRGLSQDIDILGTELARNGYEVKWIDPTNGTPREKVDINIFIEDGNLSLHRPYADKNYLLPNPEWCHFTVEEIGSFDRILCKTKEAERIFKALNSNTVYMGFTCFDRYDETIAKNYKRAIHLAGASQLKGTRALAQVWLQNPQWPKLLLLYHVIGMTFPPAANLEVLNTYLPAPQLRSLQNEYGMHICPSETEGFGYYLMEALSCGAVVVTTDAPPMNEFVLDKRCLIPHNRTGQLRLATTFHVDPLKFDRTISQLLSLSEDELKGIGNKNRQLFLENDQKFKQRIAEVFSDHFDPKREMDPVENAFTHIYTTRFWGANPSGEGSRPDTTLLYRFFLQNFLAEHHIQSVVELGCGDWGFSKLMDWSGIQYTGFDICKELIETNQKTFGSSNILFRHGNGLHVDLPSANLLICKDVLQHLPNQEILLLPAQLHKYQHVLLINDVHPVTLSSDNPDIVPGGYRLIDLTKPPFHFSGDKILTFSNGMTTKQVLYLHK